MAERIGWVAWRKKKYMKKQGVKPGVPDVLIFDIPGHTCNGIAIELKRSNGVPSDVRDTQKKWLTELESRDWLTKVAFGADDAIEWLKELDGLHGERKNI